MKYLLIVNPVSGSGSARREVAAVEKAFRKRGHRIDVRFTRGPGHAEALAREGAAADYDVIIGGGGDGTINEVLNGMSGSGKKLAIIPWGTGNVFATEMRFPRRIGAVCKMIMKGESESLDLGVANGRSFLLMVGAGVDAYSLRELKGQGLKRRLGALAYAVAAIGAFTRYRYPEIRVETAEGKVDSGSFILVSNTRIYGDVFSFTPAASPMDGLLDVFVFRETGRWATVILALRYLGRSLVNPNIARTPLGLKQSRIYRTTRLSLSSAKRVDSQIDGELGGELPLEVSILPRAVNLILPRRAMRKYRRLEESPAG
jgi:diacylglycerol kinase (ATP)